MPKTREQKEKSVKDLVEKIKNSKISLFTTQSGIDVKTGGLVLVEMNPAGEWRAMLPPVASEYP